MKVVKTKTANLKGAFLSRPYLTGRCDQDKHGEQAHFKEVTVCINLPRKVDVKSMQCHLGLPQERAPGSAKTYPARIFSASPWIYFFTDPEKIAGNSPNYLPQSIPPGDIATMRRPAETFTKIRGQIHQILCEGPRSSERPRHTPGDIAGMRRPPADTFPGR